MSRYKSSRLIASKLLNSLRYAVQLELLLCVALSACGRDRLLAIGGPDASKATLPDNAMGGANAGGAYAGGANAGGAYAGTTSATAVDCGAVGAHCVENADCCSEFCLGQACAPRPNCGKRGHYCVSNEDCCSGVCIQPDGRCQSYPGCLVTGEACTSNSDCCTSACSDPGSGIKSCQALEGCRPSGEICTKGGVAGECCSEICVYDSVSMLSRCRTDSAATCLSVGEACDNLTRLCCGQSINEPAETSPCYLTGMGVSRCLATSTRECRQDGSTCKMATDCCSHFCLPRGDGLLACAPACATYKTPCRGARDCCMGLTCSNGECLPTPSFCRQLGQPCDSQDECCSSNCNIASLSCYLEGTPVP